MSKVNEVEVVEWKEWQISLRGLRLGPASPCACACASRLAQIRCPPSPGRPRAQRRGWLGLRLRCATRLRFPPDPGDGSRASWAIARRPPLPLMVWLRGVLRLTKLFTITLIMKKSSNGYLMPSRADSLPHLLVPLTCTWAMLQAHDIVLCTTQCYWSIVAP
jgi:hypothetical protein